jgi:hypothetical protein
MAALNFTPISLYYSTTAAAVPTAGNLVAGELALNTLDEKLYFKNSAGVVKLLASNATSAPVTSFQTSLSGLTPSTATTGVVTLAGTLGVASGGTSLTTLTANNVILGNGTSAPLFVAPSTAGNVLTSNGTTWASTAPAAGGVTSFSAGTTGFTPSTATTGVVTLAGTLATTNGGTGLTSFTSGGVVYASSTSALATGSVLSFDGTNLGIGTNTPTAKLDVRTNVSTLYGAIIINSNATGQGLTVRGGSTSSQDAFNVQTYDGGLSLFAIQGGGNIGIGTSSPSNKFTLTDNSAAAMFYGTQSGAGDLFALANSASEKFRVTNAGVVTDGIGKIRAIPQSGSSKTTSYTLTTTDIGQYILLGASGAITIPDATFAAGDVVSVFNNTGSTSTITCSITTAYIAGTFTDKATMTLAAAGVATILFITGTTCVVSGNVT